MGFSNPIIGGGGSLVYPSIHSPNFVHGTSGWSINKNGTAEFQNLIIPPGSGGATVYIQATAPVTANVGDLWFNTSLGYQLSQWDGTQWNPFQFGSGALGPGSVVAGLIAANAIDGFTINAVVINGNTISATNIEIPGPAGGLFAYGNASGQQVVITLTSGTTWKVPAGITTLDSVECFGPGGGGDSTPSNVIGGGGGGAGEYAKEINVAVTPNASVVIAIPAAGTAGTIGNNGNPGAGNTTFAGNAVTITAHPGLGGNGGTGGLGGTGSGNATHFDGGHGGNGGIQLNNAAGGGGGGSGSSAGTGNAGQNASKGTYGPGGSAMGNGGPGGDGGKPFLTPHTGQVPPNGYGGGGGGGSVSSGTQFVGGNGFQGKIIIKYTPTGGTTLLTSIAGMAGTDPIGAIAYPEGIKTDNLEVSNLLKLDNIATPAAASGAALLYGASGQPAYVNPAGLQMGLQGAQLATFPGITVTQAVLTTIASGQYLANDAEIGATYELEVSGNGVWGSTLEALTMQVTFGGVAMTGMTIGNSWFPISTAFRWKAKVKIFCHTTGSSGTWTSEIEWFLSAFNVNQLPTAGSQATGGGVVLESTATETISTIANQTLALQCMWAAVTGAPTLTSRTALFKRVA